MLIGCFLASVKPFFYNFYYDSGCNFSIFRHHFFSRRTLRAVLLCVTKVHKAHYNPPINFLGALLGQNPSRAIKSDGGYQAIPVDRFDIRRSISLKREKQERKSLFQVLTFH